MQPYTAEDTDLLSPDRYTAWLEFSKKCLFIDLVS